MDNELNHHGVLGMKWGIRRFQKYPAGYHGDGKYVGPDGKPRQPTRKEARRDRKYNELRTKIDKWLVDSVETGNKKNLKRLKKVMKPEEYESAYNALVKKGIEDSVKSGDKESLKKYKNDISKGEYRDAKTLADFNDAVNKLDTKRMNQLVGKIKNEDIKESAQRIAAITDLQNKKIGALKVESELSAKINKAATTAANVASLAGSAKKVYDAVTGVKDSMQKRADDAVKRANDINEYNDKKIAEKIIKSGNDKAFERYKDKFTNQQIKDYYERKYLNDKPNVDRSILTGDSLTKIKNAGLLSYADVEKINKAKDTDVTYRAPKWDADVQKSKKQAVDKYSQIRGDAQKIGSESRIKSYGGDESPEEMRQRLKDPEKQKAFEKSKADNLTRYSRSGAVEWAANIMYNQANTDYEAYKALDTSNQTWGQAISKKSADIKSSLSKSISDLKYTPAAKKAQKEAAAAAEKLKNQNVIDAKKILDLYERNPEKFLSGEQTFVDPRKYH